MEHAYGLMVIGYAVIVLVILVVQAFWRGFTAPGYEDIVGNSIGAFAWPIMMCLVLVAGVLATAEWLGQKCRRNTNEPNAIDDTRR